jgi:hypothetical protein
MTTTEHLNRIKSQCVDLISIYDNALPHAPLPAVAGWRSTVAAIDDCLNIDSSLPIYIQNITTEMMLTANAPLVAAIIAAWPEEIL